MVECDIDTVLFVGADSFKDLTSMMKLAKQSLGEIVSAIEFLDADSITEVQAQLGYKNPITEHPFYLLVETSGRNNDVKFFVILQNTVYTYDYNRF